MLLLLVRHGITDATAARLVGRTPGISLNAQGRAQAGAAAARLASLPLRAVYTSPLERTRETASPLLQRLGLAEQVEDGLLEVDYGDWTNQEFRVLHRLPEWKRLQQRPADFRFPGGEALREAQARAVGAIERISTRHANETVAAYTHADIIRLLVAHFLGLHADLYQRLTAGPGSVTAIRFTPAGPVLAHYNDSGDLEDLKPSARRGHKAGKN